MPTPVVSKDKPAVILPAPSSSSSELVQDQREVVLASLSTDEQSQATSEAKPKTGQNAASLPAKVTESLDELLKGDIQKLLGGLSPSHFTPEQTHSRTLVILEKLGQEIPFFKKVHDAAKEKGYSFSFLSESTPTEIKDYLKATSALAVTEKLTNNVVFNGEQIAASVAKHKGQQSYGAAIVELMANEGVHILEDRIKVEAEAKEHLADRRGFANILALTEIISRNNKGDVTPTKLETNFRNDAVEDYLSTIVGNLAGLTGDKGLKEGMQQKAFPNQVLSEERMVKMLLTGFDEAVSESFPKLASLDPNSRQGVMSRQIDFVMTGEVEKQVASKLQEYGILDRSGEVKKLDIAGVVSRQPKQ